MKLIFSLIILLSLLGCSSLKVIHNSNVNEYSRNIIRINKEDILDIDVFLHEYAHYLDDNYIHVTSNIYFKKEIDKTLNLNYKILKQNFLKEFKEEEAVELQDIINAITMGAAKIKYGHSRLYWSFYRNKYREIFANLFVIYCTNKENQKKFIEKNFKGIDISFKNLLIEKGLDL